MSLDWVTKMIWLMSIDVFVYFKVLGFVLYPINIFDITKLMKTFKITSKEQKFVTVKE